MHTLEKLREVKETVKKQYGEVLAGVGIGNGTVRIYVKDNSYVFPSEIDGVPLEIILSGPITAYKG